MLPETPHPPPPSHGPRSRESHGGATSEFLVPVPRLEDGVPNSVALTTWHLALSNMIGVEISHDLMGIWLFPDEGGVTLLAPEALGQDQIPLLPPAPRVAQDQLYQLEELFRRSGYASAIAIPIRGRVRDVGLLAFGDLRRGQYGPTQAIRLHTMARDLVPTLEALAAAPPILASNPLAVDVTPEVLGDRLALAAARAHTGPEFVRMVSGILQPMLPHDRLELVAGRPGAWSLLSGVETKRRWGNQTTPASQMTEALIQRLEDERSLVMRDLREVDGGAAWPTYLDSREGRRIRSFLATRLDVGSTTVGYLFLGGVATNLYRPEDQALVETIAPLLAPRVHALRLSVEVEICRRTAGGTASAGNGPPSRTVSGETGPGVTIASVVQMLAATAHWGEALRQFAGDLRQVVAHDRLQFALRMGEAEVVLLEPGDTRPLADLPVLTTTGTPLGEILSGTATQVFRQEGAGEELLLPLRIAGRAVGAIRLYGLRLGDGRVPTAVIQQYADALAPHLEILRRASLPAPITPPKAKRAAAAGIESAKPA